MDNKIWKDVPGYEGLYKIDNTGRVFSLRNLRVIRDFKCGCGYRAIQLSDSSHEKVRYYVHRLVALAFFGLPPDANYDVNHINLEKADNRVENLEWLSHQDNMQHAHVNGKIDYRRPMRCDNTTGVKGVSLQLGGYQVSLCGKYIGWFSNLRDAKLARLDAERKMPPYE